MELKQYLKLTQQLVMTPQLQQAIKLLQLSRAELEEHIQEQLLENPVLEDAPETEASSRELREAETRAELLPSPSESVSPSSGNEDRKDPTDNWEAFIENYEDFASTNYAPSHRLSEDEMPSVESTLSEQSSLTEHLMWQLQLTELDDKDSQVAAEIIGNLNTDGYFNGELLPEIAASCGIPLEEAEWVLERVQNFDPVGVAARDVRESLLIQAEYFYPENELLQAVLDRHLPNLEKRNYQAICKDLDIDTEDLGEITKLVATLEPRPGRSFAPEQTQYITPDVYVYKVGDEYVTVLNEDGLPKLRISQLYRNALQTGAGGAGTKDYIQEKFKSAVWLIRSIHQRQNTIRKVTESIVKFQREFLDRGVEHLKPLILRDVADDIGMHESTVSRVTTNKYVHTPQGIFELKYFFNSRIGTVSTGDDYASEAVKQMIKKLVDSEPADKPYSDAKLVKVLKARNVDIARRTVAKYRDMLKIPSSSKRKRLF